MNAVFRRHRRLFFEVNFYMYLHNVCIPGNYSKLSNVPIVELMKDCCLFFLWKGKQDAISPLVYDSGHDGRQIS